MSEVQKKTSFFSRIREGIKKSSAVQKVCFFAGIALAATAIVMTCVACPPLLPVIVGATSAAVCLVSTGETIYTGVTKSVPKDSKKGIFGKFKEGWKSLSTRRKLGFFVKGVIGVALSGVAVFTPMVKFVSLGTVWSEVATFTKIGSETANIAANVAVLEEVSAVAIAKTIGMSSFAAASTVMSAVPSVVQVVGGAGEAGKKWVDVVGKQANSSAKFVDKVFNGVKGYAEKGVIVSDNKSSKDTKEDSTNSGRRIQKSL